MHYIFPSHVNFINKLCNFFYFFIIYSIIYYVLLINYLSSLFIDVGQYNKIFNNIVIFFFTRNVKQNQILEQETIIKNTYSKSKKKIEC